MSQLLLMRHGEAEWLTPDEARPLTRAGVARSEVIIDRHVEALGQVNNLLVSPYLRAQQTAALVVAAVPHLRPETMDWLTPDSDPQRVMERLAQPVDDGSTLVVAHNPLLTRLLNLLTAAPSGRYQLGTSALVSLDLPVCAAGCATLNWLAAGH